MKRGERSSPFRNIQPLFFYDQLVGVSQGVRTRIPDPVIATAVGFTVTQAIPLDWAPTWVRTLVAGAAVALIGSGVLRQETSSARIEEVEEPRNLRNKELRRERRRRR